MAGVDHHALAGIVHRYLKDHKYTRTVDEFKSEVQKRSVAPKKATIPTLEVLLVTWKKHGGAAGSDSSDPSDDSSDASEVESSDASDSSDEEEEVSKSVNTVKSTAPALKSEARGVKRKRTPASVTSEDESSVVSSSSEESESDEDDNEVASKVVTTKKVTVLENAGSATKAVSKAQSKVVADVIELSSGEESEESEEESSEASDDSDDDEPTVKAIFTKVPTKVLPVAAASAAAAASDSSSAVSSSSEDSSDSDSESDSDSSSSSDSSSESEAETKAKPASKKQTKIKSKSAPSSKSIATITVSADGVDTPSSSTLSGSPVPRAPLPTAATPLAESSMHPSRKRKLPSNFAGSVEVAVATTAVDEEGNATEVVKRQKQTVVPFSRIPSNQYVDPKLASNKFVPYDYAQRAHEKLIITKGKGFTKEKNKGKRGSYRGGKIDLAAKGIKFED